MAMAACALLRRAAHLKLLHVRLLPVPELGRRLVKATGPSHEILDRMGREQLAGRGQGIDAEIFGTADDPALPQRLDGLAIPRAAHVGEAGDTPDPLFALRRTAAPEQRGDPLLCAH